MKCTPALFGCTFVFSHASIFASSPHVSLMRGSLLLPHCVFIIRSLEQGLRDLIENTTLRVLERRYLLRMFILKIFHRFLDTEKYRVLRRECDLTLL